MNRAAQDQIGFCIDLDDSGEVFVCQQLFELTLDIEPFSCPTDVAVNMLPSMTLTLRNPAVA